MTWYVSPNGVVYSSLVSSISVFNPWWIEISRLLPLGRRELRETIDSEITENPVLEELCEDGLPWDRELAQDGFDHRESETHPDEMNGLFGELDIETFYEEYMDSSTREIDSEKTVQPFSNNSISPGITLISRLEEQLLIARTTDQVKKAARAIIGNLNEDGYLEATLEEIAWSAFSHMNVVQEALQLVQQFDPVGVAALNLSECLMIQLQSRAPENKLAAKIVRRYLRYLENQQFHQLSKILWRPIEEIMNTVKIIKNLNPRPGSLYFRAHIPLIDPDVFFIKVGNRYEVRLNEDVLPQLRLNPFYCNLLKRQHLPRGVRTYIRKQIHSAHKLFYAISYRRWAILRVSEAIIQRQGDFLDKGMDYLKPMMIKEVAEEVGDHPSTVSRAVASKYAHTPQGVLELRSFFSEAARGSPGGMLSLVSLKRKVKRIIEAEDSTRPLSDEQITPRLNDQGIQVTRRTVAKYREDLRIPSTHQRRVKL